MPPYGPRLIISTTSFQAPRQFQCPPLLSSWNLGLSRTWLDIPQSWFISSSNENSHQFSSERLSIKIDLYSYRTNTTPPNSKTGHPSLMESMALIRRQNLRWTGCRRVDKSQLLIACFLWLVSCLCKIGKHKQGWLQGTRYTMSDLPIAWHGSDPTSPATPPGFWRRLANFVQTSWYTKAQWDIFGYNH